MECARVCVWSGPDGRWYWCYFSLSWCTTRSSPSCVVACLVSPLLLLPHTLWWLLLLYSIFEAVVVLVLLRLVHLKENNRLCLFVTIICFSRRRVETLLGRRDFPISFERFDDLTVKTQVTRWLGWCIGGRMMHFFFMWVLFFASLFIGDGNDFLLLLLLQITASRKISLESSFEMSSVLFFCI